MRVPPQEMSADELPATESSDSSNAGLSLGADAPDGSSPAPSASGQLAYVIDGSSKPKKVPDALVMEVQNGSKALKADVIDDPHQWDSPKGLIGWFARWVHNHYYWNMIIGYLLIFLMAAVVFMAPVDDRCAPDAGAPQLQVCEQTAHDWELNFNTFSKLKDSVSFARQTGADEFKAKHTPDAAQQVKPRTEVSNAFQFYYLYFNEEPVKNKEQSIFTPKKVKEMCELESLVYNHELYPHFCQVDEAGKCVDQELSVVRHFYPTAAARDADKGGCKELAQADVDRIAKEAILADFDDTGFHVAYDAVQGGITNTTRSLIRFGAPFEGYKDADDRDTEQFKLAQLILLGFKCPMPKIEGYTGPDFCAGKSSGEPIKGIEEFLFDRYDMKPVGLATPYTKKPSLEVDGEPSMAIRFYSFVTEQNEFERSVNGDLSFAIFSIIVVYLYMWFHTRSVFLTSSAMFQIFMALPVGYFLYYNIFAIHYYSTLNVLVIYLALGIGADSVFVMNDSWLQSRTDPTIKTTQGRIFYSLTRTVTACLNTTLTTVMSFVATTITPVMPIYAFASFASVVLVVNYVLICALLPSVMLIYHIHFSDTGGACCYCSKNVSGRLGAVEPDADGELKEIRQSDKCYSCMPYAKQEVDPGILEAARSHGDQEDEISKLTAIERFFHNHFARIVCGTEYRGVSWTAILSIVLVLAYSAWMTAEALKLTPPTAQEEWFPSRHMLGGDFYTRLMQNWKGAADSEYMRVAFVFGIETVERSGYKWLFPKLNRGEVVYDTTFNIKKPESQRHFLHACQEIEAASCFASACKDTTLVRKHETTICVLRDMLEMYKNGGLSYSNPSAEIIAEEHFDMLYLDFFTNPNLPNEAAMEGRRDMFLDMIGRYGLGSNPEYRWAMIQYKSSAVVPLFNKEAHGLYDATQDLADKLVAEAPQGMRSMFQTDIEMSNLGWTWMDLEDALIQNLINGFSICFPVAFVVLVLATGNVIIALFATSTIAFIVAGVLGAAKVYYGWHLGIAESIAGVIVIGFSVDYTVHLGHMYREAPETMTTREERVKYALTYMGGTVLGGGFTTLGAGLVLFLCTLTFFTKMAVLLVWTILLSTILSLFYFMPLCAVLGPEGSFGAVPSMSSITSKFSSRQ